VSRRELIEVSESGRQTAGRNVTPEPADEGLQRTAAHPSLDLREQDLRRRAFSLPRDYNWLEHRHIP
jgi:hypothetical protein